MNDIPESEAQGLLSRRTFCEMDGDWIPEKIQPGTFTISAGLTDEDGVGTMMQVKLFFRRSYKTGMVNYVFSVFKRTPYSLERVYQLDIRQCRKRIKNPHDLSHEHIGKLRLTGAPEWAQWQFEDILEYFSNATNVVFSVGPVYPEHFELRGER
jgi:hypothetical protein